MISVILPIGPSLIANPCGAPISGWLFAGHSFLTLAAGHLAIYAAIVFHEAGHFLATKKFGVPVSFVQIGRLPARRFRVCDGTEIILGWIPTGGEVYADDAAYKALPLRRRKIVSAAGPAASIILTILALLLFGCPLENLQAWWRHGQCGGSICDWIGVTFGWELFGAAFCTSLNIVPFKMPLWSKEERRWKWMPSDGWTVFFGDK
jgi:membrane-associated protease RseP (regulator of RpoE activity)